MPAQLLEANFALASFRTNTWSIVPAHGLKVEDLLQRDYWAHVAGKLRPCDIIEVHAEDGTWYARLYVRAATRFEATVAVLDYVDFSAEPGEEAKPAGEDPYFVRWRNPATKFGVFIRATGECMKDGFQTKEQAYQYLFEHRKAMAA